MTSRRRRGSSERLAVLLERLTQPRPGKPREKGLTIVLDRLQPLGGDYLEIAAEYIDYAKIGWGLSLLAPPRALAERLEAYHSHGIQVLAGGTLLELAEHRGLVAEALDALWEAGFDAVEVSAGAKLIPLQRRLRMAEEAEKRGFRVFAEVGRKKPQLRMETSEMLAEIDAWLESGHAWKVVIEARESGRDSCIWDEQGRLRHQVLERIVSRFPVDRLVFEAPQPAQQAVLIRKLGPEVNLGNIGLYDVPALESLRRGLRGDTLAASEAAALWIEAPPSAKFTYYVLQRYGLLTVKDIAMITGLPPRTVYDALYYLRDRGLADSTVDRKTGEKLWYAL